MSSSVDPKDANKPLLPAIAEPVPEIQSIYETVLSLKQAVELLLGHRSPKTTAGSTGVTSGVKAEETILSIQQINAEFQVQATASQTLTTKVREVEGGVEAVASDVTDLQSEVTDLGGDVAGNSSAISSLETRVTTNEGDITANSTAITSVEAEVGDVSAEGLFRVQAVASPSGVDARLELQVRATTADAFTSSGLTLDAGVDDLGGASQAQLYATDSGGNKVATLTLDGDGNIKLDGNVLLTGSVITDGVAVDAITENSSAYTATETSLTTTEAVYQTLAVQVESDEKVLLTCNAVYELVSDTSGNGGNIAFEITRNGTPITDNLSVSAFPGMSTTTGFGGMMPWTLEDDPGAGTHTYRLRAWLSVHDGLSGTIRMRTLVSMVGKR